MNFTYKIEQFQRYENRVLVLYTSETEGLDPLREWVLLHESMTEEQIRQQIINKVPLRLWQSSPPAGIDQLVGQTFQANTDQVVQFEPNRGPLGNQNFPPAPTPPQEPA